MWSDMRVDKVLKNRTDPEKIDVIIYYDKKSSSGDIVWTVDVNIYLFRNLQNSQ